MVAPLGEVKRNVIHMILIAHKDILDFAISSFADFRFYLYVVALDKIGRAHV